MTEVRNALLTLLELPIGLDAGTGLTPCATGPKCEGIR